MGVVPTMGALHEGHLSLVRKARELADRVIVTVFVNPTQFAPGEDLDEYPRDDAGDLRKCAGVGAHVVFMPSREEMYPKGESTRVTVTRLTEYLCGAARPVHFQGVATVVTKLFAVIGPCVAVFGRKDYQQLQVVRRLVADLLLPVEVRGGAIVRDIDGVALSSRNAYLVGEERARARALVEGLSAAWAAFNDGERSVRALRELALQALERRQLVVDYVSLVQPATLEPFDDAASLDHPGLLAVAAKVGKTRLIDNLVLGEDSDPLAEASRTTRPAEAE